MIAPFPKPRPIFGSRWKRMTICNAALADNSQAIVCIADKGISYGEGIQWDSDSSKIVRLGSRNIVVMIAGMDSHITRFLAPILAIEDQLGKDIAETIKLCESEYKKAYDELIEINFLRPKLITKEDYLKGISGERVNVVFRSLVNEIAAFKVNCAFLLCGFDDKRKPFLISLAEPGTATNYALNGFHAIGTGSEKAISKLLYAEFKRTNSTDRIFYDCFDAKAFAEMDPTIGYEWDAKVVTADRIFEIPTPTKKLVEQVWAKFNRSPFEKRESDDLNPPPRDWPQQLNIFFSRMTNRIPDGRARTFRTNGNVTEGPISPEVKKMRKGMKKLLRKNTKRSGARKSKRGR
jgi:20S proteasome alpha/beta subunit